jgi:hypothetical protein
MAAQTGSAQTAARAKTRTRLAAKVLSSLDKVPTSVDMIFSPFENQLEANDVDGSWLNWVDNDVAR